MATVNNAAAYPAKYRLSLKLIFGAGTLRALLTSLAFLALSGCGIATIERSNRNEVAVTTASYERNILWPTTIRVRANQVFVPARADGQDEFCSTSPTFYSSGGPRPQPMCFRDLDGKGRFNRAFGTREKRDGGGFEVDIPYVLHPFPCTSCTVSGADLTYISDPPTLTEQSIAPAPYRPLVQAALSNSLDLDAAINRAYPNDPQAAKTVVDLSAKEVRDRRAAAICSAQNPGSGMAIFGLIGSLAAMAGGASERSCMTDYMATGTMPIPPPRLEDAGAGGKAY